MGILCLSHKTKYRAHSHSCLFQCQGERKRGREMSVSSRSRTAAWIAEVQCTTQLRGTKRARSPRTQPANKRRTPRNSSIRPTTPCNSSTIRPTTPRSFALAMAPKHDLTPSPNPRGGKVLKPAVCHTLAHRHRNRCTD